MTIKRTISIFGALTLGAGFAVLSGCATAAPTERMESSAAAIRAAEEVGANKVPQASLYLQLAREQSEHAKELIAKGGNDEKREAASLLMRAQVDGELALALARENEERNQAQQAVDKVQSLRSTNN